MQRGGGRVGDNNERIKLVHVPTHHHECYHYLLQTYTNKNNLKIKMIMIAEKISSACPVKN